MITQFQYQQVCDELDDTRSMVKVLQEEIGELDKEIVELKKENRECREYQGFWVERLILEGKRITELEKENWQCSEKLYDAEGIMNELKEELVEINRQLNLYKDNELIRESLLAIAKGGDV